MWKKHLKETCQNTTVARSVWIIDVFLIFKTSLLKKKKNFFIEFLGILNKFFF